MFLCHLLPGLQVSGGVTWCRKSGKLGRFFAERWSKYSAGRARKRNQSLAVGRSARAVAASLLPQSCTELQDNYTHAETFEEVGTSNGGDDKPRDGTGGIVPSSSILTAAKPAALTMIFNELQCVPPLTARACLHPHLLPPLQGAIGVEPQRRAGLAVQCVREPGRLVPRRLELPEVLVCGWLLQEMAQRRGGRSGGPGVCRLRRVRRRHRLQSARAAEV